MGIMMWSSKLSVGVSRFDNEHKMLVEMLNKLHDEMLQAKANNNLGTLLAGLVRYAQNHFANEEAFFKEHQYPKSISHKMEHDAFRKKAKELVQAFKSGKANLSVDTMTFLKDWLTNHILGTDMDYKAFFQSKGIQ